jgi:type I restriction enzyme S subunit
LALEVPLPPIEEQSRIAGVLDAADALRAKRRQALATLDTLSQAIFIDMFGSPGVNPNGFPVAPMIDLVDPERPITYGILKPGEDFPGGVRYVRVVDMVDGSIDPAGLRRTTPDISARYRRSILRSGDLLLSIRGHVGRLAIVQSEVSGANITQDTARLAITGAEPTYVLECLRSVEIQRWMAVFTKGAAVRGINLTDVKKIPIPLPPPAEQERLARLVARIASKSAAHRTSQTRLETLFVSLQQRAFRGEL